MTRATWTTWALAGAIFGGIACQETGSGSFVDSESADPVFESACLPSGELGCADVVVAAPGATGEGFGDPQLAVNGVRGCGVDCGSLDVFSLGLAEGENDHLAVRWTGRRVMDGSGIDFVVFENGFVSSDGRSFMDPVVISLSMDGENWTTWPVDYTAGDELVYEADPTVWVGFAGLTPVSYHEEDNPLNPFEAASGGDGFDLSDLPDEGLAGEIKRDGFVFLRLTSAAALTNSETGATFPAEGISNGADIDGVYARYLADE